ncbi:exonuclease domain-containing protein [Phenylobacterium koreense]|uniref:Exodeoxyribonuclease-1 n=1 Tax=Phenylobacterium koreense TaxID=266125 RepID=A0ABV2ELY6_9CAUL
MAGFVFFDTETTGLRPGWDQIVHVAAIRTDGDLNPTGRFEMRCRLQPHVVPHPMALLTNGLPIAQLCAPGLPSHYEMVCRLQRQLAAWSPAIFVGYNSIGFDEHMLRHAFFQCLHEPYLTSSPGNGRADALGLTLSAWALPPHCITSPLAPTGRPVFRLGEIAAANGLQQAKAHDAMSDANLTLDLCRLIRDRADDVWQRFVRFSTKAAVRQFIEAEDGFVLTEFFGNQAYHRPVALLGQTPGNPNGRLCIDLAIDPDRWAGMSDDEIRAEVARKGGPIRRLAINGAPTLTAIWDAPEALLDGTEPDLAEDRARRWSTAPNLRDRLIALYTASWSEHEPSPHPENRLYADGFPGDDDKERLIAFHDAGRQERLEIVAGLADPRLKVFGRRLIHSDHRSWLNDQDRLAGDIDLAERLIEDRAGAFTLGQALAEIDRLSAEGAPDPLGLLADYRAWVVTRAARATEFRARYA